MDGDRKGLPDLVTATNIGRRLHLSRAGVARAVASPGFPAPIGLLRSSVVWRWEDVRRWAEEAAGHPGAPTEEALHVASIRDRFRAAGFRLKIRRDEAGGWKATRVAIGLHSDTGQAFRGATQVEAAEQALAWLESHR
jgi:predicted DNA-binding transcriptional regulator AlpA